MITPEQQIRLDNWQAQHNTILTEISIANNKLEEVLRKFETANQNIINLDEEIQNRQEELKNLAYKIKSLNDKLNEKDEVLMVKASELFDDVCKKVGELSEQVEERLTYMNKVYNKKSEILAGIQSDIDDNKEKIQSPLEALKKREEEIVSKERNLNTLIRRFKIYWDKQFPDREIKI